MDGGSPSRHQEKRSKKNQDRAAVPKPFGHTKAACKCGGASGSRAARHRDDQASFDEEEEALDCAGHTIATPPTRTSTRGPGSVSQLVPFMGVSPIMQEPAMAPNLAGGWTPPLPVDYRHWVKDIRS